MSDINTRAYALKLDKEDPLRGYRTQFHLPMQKTGDDYIYFCGNSLGLQPKTLKSFVDQELEDWKNLGVEGHFHARNPWMPYHEFLTSKMANIVGALDKEVVVMNGLTVNLNLMMVSFYRPTKERYKIMIEADAFPSDQYAVKSQLAFHGYDPQEALILLQPSEGKAYVTREDVIKKIEEEGDKVALIMIGGVNYYTGQVFDMKSITEAGHKKGCVVGFDLAHAVGNINLNLHDWNIDFAVWCNYKYLNAGPGAVAGCFVHENHATDSNLPRFTGWWGHEKETRFKMPNDYIPIPGAEGWQMSNAPILSMAALRSSLEIFDEIGMPTLIEKSRNLSAYIVDLIGLMDDSRVHIISPEDIDQRGCQLSIRIKEIGRTVFEQLEANGVILDWREPDVIRIAAVPLYNSFMDAYLFVTILKKILENHE